MAEQHPRPNPTESSASQAPETQDAARTRPEQDHRAIPGGDPSRATAQLGMESVDRSVTPSTDPGQPRVEETRDRQAPPTRHGQP
jgi:hypothetical protein